MHPTLPHRPGYSTLAATRITEQRFEDSSALEVSASALETAKAVLEIQVKGVSDDKAMRLFEDMLQQLEIRASEMRSRANDIGDGF